MMNRKQPLNKPMEYSQNFSHDITIALRRHIIIILIKSIDQSVTVNSLIHCNTSCLLPISFISIHSPSALHNPIVVLPTCPFVNDFRNLPPCIIAKIYSLSCPLPRHQASLPSSIVNDQIHEHVPSTASLFSSADILGGVVLLKMAPSMLSV